jgi:hypothetical protein
MKKSSRLSPALGCSLLAVATLAAETPAAASPDALIVSAGAEVVRAWQPHQRLYVKGNLGLSAGTLSALEQWLDTHATNWVVVLLESAAGERYTDAEGQSFTGIEAVNHALGKGLMSQTPFGLSVDPRTGERNACFFALFLKDRRFSYYGSDAQDRHGLGEENWIGNLDASAIAAMRNGGRIADAVKDTIQFIESRLTTRIEAEKQEVARKAAEAEATRARLQAEAEAAVQSAAASVDTLEQRTAEFTRARPGMTGDLALPDLAGFRSRLAEARRLLTSGDPAAAWQLAGELAPATAAVLRAQDQHGADAARLEELGGRHQELAQHRRADAARRALAAAADNLKTARAEHARGDSAYAGHLAATAQALQSAAEAVAFAERMARAATLSGVFAASGACAVLGLIGLALNRRRLKVRHEAEALFANVSKALREKTDALFALLDRRAAVVGVTSQDAARRYAGETLRLSQQAIQDVDQLFIMSACVDRVLADAEALLQPKSAGARLGNRFSRRRYLRVLRLLRDEPIAFRPDEGLELIVRGARTERDRLLGGVHAYQPFAMTFEALLAAFNERAARALASLDRIESSAPEVTALAEQAQRDHDAASAALAELAAPAEGPATLRLDRVATRLLPRAATELAELLKRAANDPVGAQAGHGETTKRLTSEAATLTRLTLEARREFLPALTRHAEALRAGEVNTDWVFARIEALAAEGERLGERAVEQSVAAEIARLTEDWRALLATATRAAEVNTRRREESLSLLNEARTAVAAARAEFGKALGLDPERTLREAGHDPSDALALAEAQWRDARAGLDRGDVASAENALNAVAWLTGEAQGIVAASRNVLASREESVRTLRRETARLAASLPEHQRILDEIVAGYTLEVLSLGAGDAEHPQANGTVADNPAEAQRALDDAASWLSEAERALGEARLLEAAQLWERVKAAQEIAAVRLMEIAEKRERLRKTGAANRARFAQVETQANAVLALANAAATMQPTREAIFAAQQRLEALRPAVAAADGNPFAMAEELEAVAAAFAAAADRARCDRDVFEEAQRSVRAAAAQWGQAQQAARDARSREVPRSAAAQAALQELDTLVAAARTVEAALSRPHADWNAVDAEADRICGRAAAVTATLRGEIARADAALGMLSTAAAAVRRAGGWTGGLGVLIAGSPGSEALDEARAWLQRGEYDRARSLAESARRMAEAALAAAEAELHRRQVEEHARRERERRRRQAEEAARQLRRAASWGGGLGGGVGGGGRSFGGSSWGASGSGARTSSFGSGSGARTSGW